MDFRGDAVIFAPCDGFKRFSEIVIDSINLWVRIYDIPVKMMRVESFVRALGERIGTVLEVGEARMDYKRIKVVFPLEKALMPTVQMRVKDRGVMVFEVRYENVLHFCFVCGRIGHAERECPEEVVGEGGIKFGTALRCSPQKKEIGKRLTIPAGDYKSKKGLNFSGGQKEKVMSATGSSNQSANKHGGWGRRRAGSQRWEESADAAADLADEVANMSVDKQEEQAGKDKVSGLYSFEDSLHTSTNEVEHMSMHERHFWVSSKAAGRGTSQDTDNRTGSVADMEVDKQKRVNVRSTGAT
ncbi:hypothetical protein HU200_005032 [Digitaria exilis]|uniref:CCHC-type domain-containing protein n=1 Tax=Digitaria exilis TaxID=1010633 RepID=A0A835FUN7_9POAL|nr:hypothetical protein HU200_005032 [Digitaria exilis]